MIDRIRTLAGVVAGTAVVTAALGLAAVGLAGQANAEVCAEYYSDGSVFYYYC